MRQASRERGYAVAAGVMSVDHAYQLSDATMKAMKEKQIYAVPTFAIAEYFADHAASPALAERERAQQAYHAAEFKKQLAAGVPMAVGSDVGPFPHGTQARELELMVQYGMTPADCLRADLLNGAKLLGWAGQIGELKPGYYADVIAVEGDPGEGYLGGDEGGVCDEGWGDLEGDGSGQGIGSSGTQGIGRCAAGFCSAEGASSWEGSGLGNDPTIACAALRRSWGTRFRGAPGFLERPVLRMAEVGS